MDAILYYTELKAFVSKEDQKILDSIIAEERKHFAQLSEIKKVSGLSVSLAHTLYHHED
jgi:rubrerythrin